MDKQAVAAGDVDNLLYCWHAVISESAGVFSIASRPPGRESRYLWRGLTWNLSPGSAGRLVNEEGWFDDVKRADQVLRQARDRTVATVKELSGVRSVRDKAESDIRREINARLPFVGLSLPEQQGNGTLAADLDIAIGALVERWSKRAKESKDALLAAQEQIKELEARVEHEVQQRNMRHEAWQTASRERDALAERVNSGQIEIRTGPKPGVGEPDSGTVVSRFPVNDAFRAAAEVEAEVGCTAGGPPFDKKMAEAVAENCGAGAGPKLKDSDAVLAVDSDLLNAVYCLYAEVRCEGAMFSVVSRPPGRMMRYLHRGPVWRLSASKQSEDARKFTRADAAAFMDQARDRAVGVLERLAEGPAVAKRWLLCDSAGGPLVLLGEDGGVEYRENLDPWEALERAVAHIVNVEGARGMHALQLCFPPRIPRLKAP